MKLLLQHVPPFLTVMLIGIWLLLSGEVSIAQVVLGGTLAVVFVLAIAQLRPVRPRLRRLYLAVPLAFTVIIDSMRSNFGVARIVLGLVRDREVRGGFVDIPLELQDPHGLAILAAIVTATPGTSWAGVSNGGQTLTLHVLDLRDDAEWASFIKQRYERPLMRIFE